MALLKGKHSLLRYLGFIAAIFASLQALVWIGMYISGIICFYIRCGFRQPANRFGKAFNNIYLSTKLSKHYPHIVTPIFFHILLWFFVILSAVWLFASVSLIVDYRKWANAKRLRKSSKRWIVVTIIVCVLNLLLFVLFVVDFDMLKSGQIGASVRSMNNPDYEDGDDEIRPHDPFEDYYEAEVSDRNILENATVPSATALTQDPGVTSEGPSTPALTFDERLRQIEANLARKNADVDKRIENLLAKAKLIRETELGTHYNPYVRVKTAKLMEQLTNLEKLYGERGKTEDEQNKNRMMAEKKKAQSATTTEQVKTKTAGDKAEAKENTTNDEDYSSDDSKYQNDSFDVDPSMILAEMDKLEYNARDYDDMDEKLDSSSEARRKLDRMFRKLKARLKNTDDARNDSDKVGKNQANSGLTSDEYNALWRSTFHDEDYGIILQNDGPGTAWRKIADVYDGSSTGTDVMLAPSAVLMTLAIRGYVLWIVNLTAALMLLYLYITRPRRPTLITRVQA